jgi:hypothetical protein
MLDRYLDSSTMIEVLIDGDLPLPDDTAVVCYSDIDAAIARNVLASIGSSWAISLAGTPMPYPRRDDYGASVRAFIQRAISDPTWRGNGLEFDGV